MGEAGFFGFFLASGAAIVALLAGPVGQAIGRRIGGGKHGEPKSGLSTGEMAAERVAHLEDRVQELEERVDFAERMLGQASAERPVLPKGDSQ